VRTLVVKTQEEWEIAKESYRVTHTEPANK
jgi:hypothetical protein